jgi:hypothetical protein
MSGKFILPNKGIGSAESVSLNTSTFNGVLSSADDTVQKALQTIDDAGGLDGSDGATGIKGETGIQGAQGETGIQGTTGAQGIKGDQGDAFQVDFFGSFDEAMISSVESGSYTPSDPYMQVVTTDDRSNTTSPINGDLEGHAVSYDGASWYDFGQFTGLKGERGETGIAGLAGIQGETGLQGVAGAQGETGIQGIAGAQGTTGVAGIQGATGIMGIMGIKGDQGDTGIQGVTGPQGVDSGPKNLQQVLDTGDSADRSASLAGSVYGGHIALKKEFRNGNDGEQWVDQFSRHMFQQDGQRKNILGGNMVSQTQTDLDLYPAGISLTPASGLINIPPWFSGYTTRLLTKIETSWVGFVGDNQYLRQTIHDQNRGISAERFKSSTGTWSSWEPLTSNQLIVSNGNEGPESDVWQNGVYYSSVTSGSSGYPAGFGLLMGIREGNSRHVQYFYERYSSNTYVRYQSNAENTWSSWTMPGGGGSGEELLHKITIVDGVTLNQSVSVDTDTYPFLEIRVTAVYTGVSTGSTSISMGINGDFSTNAYGNANHFGGRNSSGTSITSGGWSWASSCTVGSAGGSSAKAVSINELDARNDGGQRVVLQKALQSSSSSYVLTIDRAYVWQNTSDDITSLVFNANNSTLYGYIWVYGKSD